MVDADLATGMPRSLARSRSTLTRSSGFDFSSGSRCRPRPGSARIAVTSSRDKPVELIDFGAAHADLNGLLPERSGLGQPERQPGHLFDFLARRAQHFAERSAAMRLQLDVNGALGDRPVLRPCFADRRIGIFDRRQLAQLRYCLPGRDRRFL